MTYDVVTLDALYLDDNTSSSQEVREYLNEAERNGYTLVGIIPDHAAFDANGEQDGVTPAMLVVHKADAPQRDASAPQRLY